MRNLISLAAVLFVTATFAPFREYINSTEIALTFLLVVLFASTLFGSTSGLLASVGGILSFNFFFLPPYHTFNIAGPENWVAFGTFVITALIAGQLSGYARRRAEESEARQKEIERLYEELQTAFEQASEAEALRRSEKLKSALLDAVTHDLRTPLTSIKASATTLLENTESTDLDEDARTELLEIINEETDRLNEFIGGMVQMARVEADATNLRRRSASVEEIVTNAVERLRRSIGDRELRVELAPDLPNVFADASSISEVIYTLLDNSIKYSPESSKILVTGKVVNSGSVDMSVQDQGKGIPEGMREKVFDKFFRVGEQDIHRTGSGLGLGLAIARGIVDSQGGVISVGDADPGFVTKFILTLPVSDETTEDGKLKG
jgi:K+-sensing histidine kinase KdpD